MGSGCCVFFFFFLSFFFLLFSQTLPHADASFDVITCVQVLSYVPDPVAALAEMARVLRKPHGRILVLDTDWRTSVYRDFDFI